MSCAAGAASPDRGRFRGRSWEVQALKLFDLFVQRGLPDYIRSDNGAEFTAMAVRDWLGKIGVKTLYIQLGSPWENGYVESFNGKCGMSLRLFGINPLRPSALGGAFQNR